jgi:hypothetical protein
MFTGISPSLHTLVLARLVLGGSHTLTVSPDHGKSTLADRSVRKLLVVIIMLMLHHVQITRGIFAFKFLRYPS